MNMNGAFSRQILCTTLILACIAAAREESVEVEWGTGKFTIQCYPAEEDSSAKNSTYLYWYKVLDGEEKLEYVQRSNGSVTYKGENPISGVVNDYGSMTLEADYTSDGKYKCTHRSGHSFYHTLITVRVIEPPLRVLECNSTSDANHSCQVTVRSDEETLTFNVIKAGRLGSNGSIVLFNASQLPVVSESHYTSRNDDDSITIRAQFVLNASGLTLSRMLHFALLVYGETTEERPVQLNIPDKLPVIGPTVDITSIVVPVIAGLIVLIVLFVLYKTNILPLERLRESCCRGKEDSSHNSTKDTIESTENSSGADGAGATVNTV